MQNKLYHPLKGILTMKKKTFHPLKGVQNHWIDEDGNETQLDGTELPPEALDMEIEQEQQKGESKKKQKDLEAQQAQEEADEEAQELAQKQVLEEKESQMHTEVLNEVKNASEAIIVAVKAIPETVIPEVKIPDHLKEYEQWKNDILEALKIELPENDYTPIVEAVTNIKFPTIPSPIDYTKALADIKKALPKGYDDRGVIEAIEAIKFPEFPPLKFTKSGSLRVAMDEIAVGSAGGLNAVDSANLSIIAGKNYDTTSIDTTNPLNIVITYSLAGVTVATETITKSGSIINIVKT